jgi:Rha family phage regulatory protein
VANVMDVNDGDMLKPLEASEMVRVREGGDIVTDSVVIAGEFGRRHDKVLESLRLLVADRTINRPEFREIEYVDGRGRKQPGIELTERGALIAMPFIGGKKSRDGQVRLVDAFLAMRERLRATTKVEELDPFAAQRKLTAELAVAECVGRLINASESGKLAMVHAICAQNAVDTHFLPTTAVDAPPGEVSSLEAQTATELLRRRGAAKGVKGASAISFNKRALAAGYLRESSRPTTNLRDHPDGRKRFLMVTIKGLTFGKNVVDMQSPRETQPRWYTERFDAFCRLLWSETRDFD